MLVRPVSFRIVSPQPPSETLLARLEAHRAEIITAFGRQGDSCSRAYLLLFANGDFVCFSGRRVAGEAGRATYRVRLIVAYRLDPMTDWGWVYGRLVPGASFELAPEELRGAAEGDPWCLPLTPDALLCCELLA